MALGVTVPSVTRGWLRLQASGMWGGHGDSALGMEPQPCHLRGARDTVGTSPSSHHLPENTWLPGRGPGSPTAHPTPGVQNQPRLGQSSRERCWRDRHGPHSCPQMSWCL